MAIGNRYISWSMTIISGGAFPHVPNQRCPSSTVVRIVNRKPFSCPPYVHVRTNVQRTGRGYLQCYKRYVISHKILSDIPIRSLSQSDACCKHGIIQVCFNSLIQANPTPLPPQEVQQEVHPCIAMSDTRCNKRNSSNPWRFCALCSKCAEFIPLFYVDGPHRCDG